MAGNIESLEAKGLVKSYKGRKVVDRIDLTLNRNEIVGLLGPNGAGKTTSFYMIIGLIRPEEGRVFLDGQDIGLLPPQKRHIGYVAQSSDLFPHLSVRKNIAFGLAYQNITAQEKQRRVDRYLDLFGLFEQADQPATTLSGGENKRTAMARSLIVKPKILLLDEPLGMLDQNGRKAILETLKMIHDELRTTTIHVTHDRSLDGFPLKVTRHLIEPSLMFDTGVEYGLLVATGRPYG